MCSGRAQAVEERHEWAAAYHDGGQAGPMTAPTFRTDVSIRAPAAQPLLDRPYNARGLSSSEYLDSAAENVNKQIDSDVKAMLDAFEALVGLSRVRDKDKYRIAQESLELEARADVMVRAAQSLTLLSHSLKLSLLLSQEPIESAEQDGTSLDEEALQLIQSTGEERERCARLLEGMFGLGGNGVNAATGGTAMNGGETAKQPGEGFEASVPVHAGSAGDTLPTHGDGLDATADDEDLEMEAVE